MASNTVIAATIGPHASVNRHLRLVDGKEAQRIADQRRLQWEAMQAGHASPVRLTKRGRRVLAVLVLLPLASLMWLFAGRGAVAEGTAPTTQTVVVQPGQSLWDIAQTVAPKADPRATIYKIKQLNHLTGSDLRAGQALIAPAGS